MTHGTTNLDCPNYSLPHGPILSKSNLLPCSVLVEFCHTICPIWIDIVKRQIDALLNPSGTLPHGLT